MKLLAWNIRQDGGSRRSAIGEALARHDPDIIVLSEMYPDSVRHLRGMLCMKPWQHYLVNATHEGGNAVCVMGKTRLCRRSGCPAPDENASRWLDVEVPEYGLGIGALHIVTDLGQREADGKSMRRFWDAVLTVAADRNKEPFVFIGDLNSGIKGVDGPMRSLSCSRQLERMTELGWIDAWRRFNGPAFEPTWISASGTAYRLDHAFVSTPLSDRLTSCAYSHVERESRISDHSVLFMEIEDIRRSGDFAQ